MTKLLIKENKTMLEWGFETRKATPQELKEAAEFRPILLRIVNEWQNTGKKLSGTDLNNNKIEIKDREFLQKNSSTPVSFTLLANINKD